jgi:hypothetical protein
VPSKDLFRLITTKDFLDKNKILSSAEEEKMKRKYDHKVIHTDEEPPIITDENAMPPEISTPL